jgi:glycerophosphoryl diester phosphodiesterase
LLFAAREAGLSVHPYTLRAEEPFLVREHARVLAVEEEATRLLDLGVQGFFIDQPAQGRRAVDEFLQRSADQQRPKRSP